MAARIIGLCAAGLTVRDIQSHLLDLYGLKVSPDLISRVRCPALPVPDLVQDGVGEIMHFPAPFGFDGFRACRRLRALK